MASPREPSSSSTTKALSSGATCRPSASRRVPTGCCAPWSDSTRRCPKMDDDLDRLTPPVGPRDHRQGPDDAPVTLVEYGDFECPYCRRAHPIIKEVQRALGDRL